ncbi:hypothetical protein CGLO_13403 [Colletotrichum gloeosporioides Cg-14]|uniref:Uncharacterized protein n=1 Tax=Colletotrichum gloeosporioides (strain Cg-14) TaxID=1237896 RepID=T0K664_COLGC|nr:hypothetical protein CGLO_13403 [Colletotrichum gloeosporioides Cg-14]
MKQRILLILNDDAFCLKAFIVQSTIDAFISRCCFA